MTYTHIQGPWEIEHCINEDGSKFITINGQGPHGAWLADIQAGNIDGKPADVTERHLANARLIAAAPDLLSALQLLMDQYDSSPDFTMGGNLTNAPFIMARAAIAKATGKEDV
jgi:hypothetical protein